MQFDIEWIGIPDSGDPIESRTWARLVCRVGRTTITRAYDRLAGSIGEGIYVPLYPLAAWIVTHWWTLLYEPWPFGQPLPRPDAVIGEDMLEWVQRHCLRVANPGYAGPFACIFSQGRAVTISCRRDPTGGYRGIQVEFTESADVAVTHEDVRDGLSKFVTSVLRKLEDFPDERVDELRDGWSAICNMRADEQEFCRAAGRLGLHPYDVDAWPDGVSAWLEQAPPGQLDSALMTDLLETPDPAPTKLGQSAAIFRLVTELALDPAVKTPSTASRGAAHADGYALASDIRSKLSLSADDRIADIREVSLPVVGRAMDFREAALPEGRVLAVAGMNANALVVARRSEVLTSARFLACRGLYMALEEVGLGPRLVTDARTWTQRASRAFAAELLAPRATVTQRYAEAERRVGRDEAELVVAKHFDVSPRVVRHQLMNAEDGTDGM
jgi:hypothetical protein